MPADLDTAMRDIMRGLFPVYYQTRDLLDECFERWGED
jgi:hypothetical protein